MTGNRVNNAKSTRGKPFPPGNSGRRPGSRNKRTVIGEKLMADEAESIARAIIDAAKAGDPTGMRICADRIFPVRKGRPQAFGLPPITTADDVGKALDVVLRRVADGDLTTDEGNAIGAMLELKRKAIETDEHERRLAAIEERLAERGFTR